MVQAATTGVRSPTAASRPVREAIVVAGMAATPLDVQARAPRFLERWSGVQFGPIYEVSWTRQVRLRLPGLRSIQWTHRSGSRFLKLAPDDLVLPLQAEVRRQTIAEAPEVEEVAVFEEIGIDPILAVRVGGDWYELCRWLRVPLPLPPRRRDAAPTWHLFSSGT